MEPLRRFGGTAGVLMALSGLGIVYFLPGQRLWGWILLGAGLALSIVAALLNSEDLLNLMRGRPFRFGANALFYSLFVLLLVAGVDLLAARHNRRFDLTTEGLHTLSPQTVQILKGLDQDVTVVAFYSSEFSGGRQKALDLLEEYKYHSPRISLKVIDPVRNPAEARAYRIESDGTIVVSTEKGEARLTSATEEELTNALVKATAETKKLVCVTTGHGERRIQESGPDGLQQAADAIKQENFEVKEVRLLEGEGALEGCSSLIVAGPTHPMVAPEVEAVGAHVRKGGRLLVLREPRRATGLEDLLERHGLKSGQDFIVDINPVGRLFGGSPAAPVVYEYGAHPITKDFEGLMTIFPTVGSVETVAPVEGDVTTQVLAHTGSQSWGENGEMADRVSFDPGQDRAGPLDIAATAVRRPRAEAPEDPNAGAEVPGEAEAPPAEARIVLFGDSDFASNSAILVGGNKDLFLNTLAWLNERADLISIRAKTRAPQPIILTGLQARLLYGWWALGPLLALVVGVGVFVRRRGL